ncbi:MAG: prepilin-type N-terminal cleavage/methylation domain-containing protein [Pseudomonadota bacterium]|nr:prepilin-type N-terminal cleavage/methylation domain-containing protein [Pseudomonadota bacterium]
MIGPTRGFSLIEVLIAVAVLAVGLIAMARFQGTALQASSLAKERSEAVALAEQKIEQLRNFTNFANIGTTLPCGTDTLTNRGVVTTVAANIYYTRTCTLGATVSTGIGILYQYRNVSVRVTWARPGASAADTGVTLTTTINNAELNYSGKLT